MNEPMAGLRDASWYRSPGGAGHYHITLDSGEPACNPKNMLLTESTLRPASEVPETMRCQRSGCRQKWRSVPTPDTMAALQAIANGITDRYSNALSALAKEEE